MKQNYIQATVSLLEAGTPVDTVLLNLKQLLEKYGHGLLYGAILRGLVSNFEQRSNSDSPLVIVASAKDAGSVLVREVLAKLKADSKKSITKIDPSIVGGTIVSYHHQMIDCSYKTKLKDLYQSVIS